MKVLKENKKDFGYIPLRVTTQYSLLEGAMKVDELVKKAVKLNIPALGVTDRNNLFGALEFSEYLSNSGIQPIIGCNFGVYHQGQLGTVICYAKNESGYKNLIKISSEIFLNNNNETIDLRRILELNENLICLSGGCEGLINNLLKKEKKKEANELAALLGKTFENRFYIELQRLGIDNHEEDLLNISYDFEIPFVATNPVFFESKNNYVAHDALISIKDSTTVDDPTRKRLTQEFYFKSPNEMNELFKDIPEALENSVEIAKRASFKVNKFDPRLPRFGGLDYEGETSELVKQARKGLERRLDEFKVENKEIYRERLKEEIKIITSMKFPGYFLIVSDFIKWAKKNGIPVGPGRGSGAGSVVAWALTITDLDPIRFNLIFERFLNPERVSLPDFDIDFCQERREEVIEYVQEKYGEENVAQIITFGSLQSRAVLRDVGRVLGLPYGQVDNICKLIPNNPANPTSLKKAIEGDIRIRDERDNNQDIASMLEIGLELEGLLRNASTHAAGLVIGDIPLQELIPLYRDPRSDMPVTQFNMKWVEASGLVKFDFLGLKTLTVIDKAIRLIEKNNDIKIDLSKIPLDDNRTFELLGTGNTVGIFQLESNGMQDVLRSMKPDCFEDIIALVALYRPGPMDNIPKFIACKKGDEVPDYMDPSLEPILKETYGVIIYQEQVMQTAQILSNYSLGEADILRRAMGKKIKAEMEDQKERFINGAIKNGIEKSKASYIFDQVSVFAGYGFNKCHAAPYALIAYQTAYLKAYYPEHFLTASMTLDKENTDKLSIFVNDAKSLGIRILPPDVNTSKMEFEVEGKDIRYGLGAIKNTSQIDMKKINEESIKNGHYKNLYDFAQRLDSTILSKKNLEYLSYAGAFDSLEDNRNKVFNSIKVLSNISSASEEINNNSQENLFEKEFKTFDHIPLPNSTPWTNSERLTKEFSAIGFYLSGHPLEEYSGLIKRKKATPYKEIINGSDHVYKIVGTISYVKERKSQKGKNFAFVGLTDPNNQFEITVFSELLFKARDILVPGNSILVEIETQRNSDNFRLLASKLSLLNETPKSINSEEKCAYLRVYIDKSDAIVSIKENLIQEGDTEISICLFLDNDSNFETELSLGKNFLINSSIIESIKNIDGVSKIEEI